ncbi:Ig-like domain-containing protein [Cohnella yongneupensis]|uniref:Ig-like domain-containing protein n=1 Tax=Cohnella yongneupensis TaxID=425006 RepID=A0ABW0QW49_9BACL
MQLRRTLLLALILSLLAQLWVAGASYAAPTGPAKISSYPADNDTSVPANAKLKLVFDENVTKATGGTVAIKDSSTNIAVVSYNVTDSRISFDPVSANTVVIDPNGLLVAGHSYYVEISPNAFLNGSGLGYSGISNATEWNFDVIASDSTAPSAALAPANGGTMLATDALRLTFNEKVFAAAGSIRIVRTDTGDTQVISVLSSAVSGSGIVNGTNQTVITIQPPTRLVSGKPYEVLVENNAFVDVVGNKYALTSWTFTTTAPAVALPTTVPADNASGITAGSLSAQMTFAVNMQKGNTGTIQLKRVSDNVTVDTINMAVDSSRVTVNGANVTIAFSAALAANTGYYILVDPGVLKDASNNVYEGIVDAVSWNFTTQATADTVDPTVVALSPVNGGTTTAVNGALTIKFSEPVKPGSGTIVIRHTAAPQTVFCSIPITSSAVVGGGTDTLTITPSIQPGCGNFVQNTVYAVQIGNLAITDLAGRNYAGIGSNDFATWWFKVTSDAVAPELIGTMPVAGSQTVKSTATFSMQFSEEIAVPNGNATLVPSGGGTAITATITRDNADLRKAVFSVTGLAAATTYIVRIPNDAITDLALNRFPGILNDYRWTFKTIGGDTTAPQIASASMDGSAVLLTYNEELDPTFVPYPGNYYVTVNDVPRQVNFVAVSGNAVRLTLQSGVALGQGVKVSYTVDGDPAHRLQDLSGNQAPLLNAQVVTNTSDTTLPRPVSGTLNGTTLVLNFNKPLQALTSAAASQFTVKFNGSSQGINLVSVSGSTLTIILYGSGINAQSVSVSYTPGTTPLRDLSGNGAAAFADFFVQNLNDTQPPQLTSAAALGTNLKLTFNEGLLSSSVPLKSNFSVISDGQAMSISSIAVSNNSVDLTLAQPIAANANAYVSYLPSTPGIVDLSGNPAGAFSSYRIVAGSTAVTPLVTATANGSSLILTYGQALNLSSVPYSTQYFVKANNAYDGVTSVVVQGTQVFLTLATPIVSGQVVTVSYSSAGIPLKDILNQPVDSFSERAVINASSTTGNGTNLVLPDYLESDGNGGLRFIVAKSTTSEWNALASGRAGNRYIIDGDKLLAAYDKIRLGASGGITKPILTLKIPTTEQVAQVSVPIRSLMDAAARASNASLRIEFGDLQFTLPLTAINYSKELYLSNADVSTAKLILTIEKTQDTNLSSAINIQTAALLASPADFSASVLYSGKERPIDAFDMYVTRTFTVSSFTGTTDNVAVVRYDKDAGELVYVPTQVTVSGTTATVDFKRKSNSIYAVIRKDVIYTDMTKHWAVKEVTQLASKFIVDGPKSKTFAPDKNITRAEFAEYLARGLGLSGDKQAASRYQDVSATNASAAYIGAVSKAGIVEGGNDGTFRPNASITREEMATMLVRAMSFAGVSTVSTPTSLNSFKDKAKVSSWAKEGMQISVMAGLIKGISATELKPQNNATRAEATVMLKRFLEYSDLL